MNGAFLSVYETSDGALTCKKLQNRSPRLTSFKEISIATGLEHGAFYRPLAEWVAPVKQWIKERHR